MEIRLLKTLEKLKDEEFDSFKWFLKQDNILEGKDGIPTSRLEKADRQDTVDRIIQKYHRNGALELTTKILTEMDMNMLVRDLHNTTANDTVEEGQTTGTLLKVIFTYAIGMFSFRRKPAPPTDHCKQVYVNNLVRPRVQHKPKLKTPNGSGGVHQVALQEARRHLVDVTLDVNTAHPNLILSEDGKRVQDGDVRQQLPYDRRRFTTCVSVLGQQGVDSGKFYFEVQVKEKIAWTLGVAAESIERKGEISVCPDDGFWTIRLRNSDEYAAANNNLLHLQVDGRLEKVGVFVDYESGLVSFYNADTERVLYSFTGYKFTEKLLPYLSPCCNYDGTNSNPLIICPVSNKE